MKNDDRESMAEMWEGYKVAAASDPVVDVFEDRRHAFYAGAVAFASAMSNAMDGDLTRADRSYLKSLWHELEEFTLELCGGAE